MHARVVRLTGSPEGAEERTMAFRSEALPVLAEQPGFEGVVTTANADGGSVVVTYWDSAESLASGREVLAQLRERMTAGQGLEVLSIEEYEIAVMERSDATGPVPGNAVRLTRGRGSVEALEAVMFRLRDEALTVVRELHGFKALIAGVDRSSGRFYIVSGWESAADRDASEEPTAQARARIAEGTGVTDIEVERYEISFAELDMGVRP